MSIYDKIVDPISTPKAIDSKEAKEFYDIYMSIKNIDISFLESIITLVEKKCRVKEIENFFMEYVLGTRDKYIIASDKANLLYEKLNLKYDAKLNPFVM